MARVGAVSALPGLGPKSAALLARVGVHSADQLHSADPLRLYLQLKALEPRVSLNMLWGLVSAQTGKPWQQVACEDKSEWLARLAAHDEALRT